MLRRPRGPSSLCWRRPGLLVGGVSVSWLTRVICRRPLPRKLLGCFSSRRSTTAFTVGFAIVVFLLAVDATCLPVLFGHRSAQPRARSGGECGRVSSAGDPRAPSRPKASERRAAGPLGPCSRRSSLFAPSIHDRSRCSVSRWVHEQVLAGLIRWMNPNLSSLNPSRSCAIRFPSGYVHAKRGGCSGNTAETRNTDFATELDRKSLAPPGATRQRRKEGRRPRRGSLRPDVRRRAARIHKNACRTWLAAPDE